MKYLLLTILATAALAMGCQANNGAQPQADAGTPPAVSEPIMYDAAASGGQILKTSLYAADALIENLEGRLNKTRNIVTVSLVDLSDLESTTAFGRLVSNQVASRLAQHGYAVAEARLRDTMALKIGEGESMLSRDTAKLLRTEFRAFAAMVGMYETTSNEVFVSLRIIRLTDGVVIGAHEYALPNTQVVSRLLEPASTDWLWHRYAKRRPAFSHDQELPTETPTLPPMQSGPGVGPPSRLNQGGSGYGDMGGSPGAYGGQGHNSANGQGASGGMRNFPQLAPPTQMIH